MNEYQDKWGRYHDKPCVNGEPKSNNGWIYSAYALKLGFELDFLKLNECYQKCKIHSGTSLIAMNRSPGKQDPPMSRDEILGLYWLGFIPVSSLVVSEWNFSPYPIPGFNPLKTIAAFWRLRKAHRNALWDSGGEPHAFALGFSLPITDRAYILRASGMKVPLSYSLFEKASNLVSKKSDSSALIEWGKTGGKPDQDLFIRYFSMSHPFTKRVLGEV